MNNGHDRPPDKLIDADDTEPTRSVGPIRSIARTAMAASGQEFQTRGAEGLITLIEPPAPCFFNMH